MALYKEIWSYHIPIDSDHRGKMRVPANLCQSKIMPTPVKSSACMYVMDISCETQVEMSTLLYCYS